MIFVQRYHDGGRCGCGETATARLSDSDWPASATSLRLCTECQAALAYVLSEAGVQLELSAAGAASLAEDRITLIDHRVPK